MLTRIRWLAAGAGLAWSHVFSAGLYAVLGGQSGRNCGHENDRFRIYVACEVPNRFQQFFGRSIADLANDGLEEWVKQRIA